MHSIVRVLLRGFSCANFIMPLGGFHRANSIVLIPSCGFHPMHSTIWVPMVQIPSYSIPLYGFHGADYIVWILSYGFHSVHSIVYCANSIVWISLGGFLHANFIVQIPSCVFHCVHSIICILLCNRRRKEEVKKDEKVGTLAHCFHICICVAVDINGDASTDNVLGENPLTESASTTLYQSHYICEIDY